MNTGIHDHAATHLRPPPRAARLLGPFPVCSFTIRTTHNSPGLCRSVAPIPCATRLFARRHICAAADGEIRAKCNTYLTVLTKLRSHAKCETPSPLALAATPRDARKSTTPLLLRFNATMLHPRRAPPSSQPPGSAAPTWRDSAANVPTTAKRPPAQATRELQ